MASRKNEYRSNMRVSTRLSQSYSFKVAGASYRQPSFKDLVEGNENDWYTASKRELQDNFMEDERIYQYDYNPVEVSLVDEPDNAYDPNAIKVLIDGEHIGYVPSAKCTRVKDILENNTILSLSAEIYGGKYKILTDEGFERGTADYGAEVTIRYSDNSSVQEISINREPPHYAASRQKKKKRTSSLLIVTLIALVVVILIAALLYFHPFY